MKIKRAECSVAPEPGLHCFDKGGEGAGCEGGDTRPGTGAGVGNAKTMERNLEDPAGDRVPL